MLYIPRTPLRLEVSLSLSLQISLCSIFTMISALLLASHLILPLAEAACISSQSLSVTSNTGVFTGLLNPTYPTVREFRTVPYALPPTGDLRWLPPQKLPASNKRYDATQYPRSCPQFVSRVKSVWSENIPEWLIFDGGESTSAGLYAYGTSEDCLSLAIWTPANATAASKLPVIMFMTGGKYSEILRDEVG